MVKDAQRVGDGQLLGTGAEGAEGLEPGASRFGADGLDEIRSLFRSGGGGRIRPGLDGPAFRWARHGNELALWLEVGDSDGSLEDVAGGGLTQLVDRGYPRFAVLYHPDPHADIALGDVLVDAIICETGQRAVPLGDHHLGLLRR